MNTSTYKNATTYMNAFLDDGRYVLDQVTSRLYRGDKRRPDVYFQDNPYLGILKYNEVFSKEQRLVLEQGFSPWDYNITLASQAFGVQTHIALQMHACRISTESFLLKIITMKKLADTVGCTSNRDISVEFLADKLRELLKLYTGIIEDLEIETGDDLTAVKEKIKNRIDEKMPITTGMFLGGAVGFGLGVFENYMSSDIRSSSNSDRDGTPGSVTNETSNNMSLVESVRHGLEGMKMGIDIAASLESIIYPVINM